MLKTSVAKVAILAARQKLRQGAGKLHHRIEDLRVHDFLYHQPVQWQMLSAQPSSAGKPC